MQRYNKYSTRANNIFSIDSSPSHDGKYYFYFMLPKTRVKELPDRLVHQALAIAQKVDKMIAGRVGKKGSRK